MPILMVEVTQSTLAVLNKRARDKGCGMKAEGLAADILEHDARKAADLSRLFVDAANKVDKQLGTG